MPTLFIDRKKTEVPAGATVLDAARKLGIDIPTLCFLEGYPHFASCMLCVVKDRSSGRLFPACSMPAQDGMDLESETDEVREVRRKTLELLLGEHVGDCEAPCRRSCPAHMNIPLMIRQIASGNFRDALMTVKQDIALPAVLGRICPAPCEKACRRGHRDQPLAICLLKRFVADADLAEGNPYLPHRKEATGKRVAIVGAGPTGLAAAWHLAQHGHACTVFDDHDRPGGMLRYAVPEDRLPRDVLDKEIDAIQRLGVEFCLSCRVGADFAAGELAIDFDAVILAVGAAGHDSPDGTSAVAPADSLRRSNGQTGTKADGRGGKSELSEIAAHLGLEVLRDEIKVDPATFQTGRPGIFAGGSVIHRSHLAVRAVAHGKAIAGSVHQFLSGRPVTGPRHRFNSVLGKLDDGEIREFMKGAAEPSRVEPAGGFVSGFSRSEAVRESARCMRCDCRKADGCRLRLLAEQLDAGRSHFRVEGRHRFERIQQPGVVYEPGKCIKCGICVRICEKSEERLGLTFIGRGFQARVGVPFDEPLSDGLARTASECIAACPTGALADGRTKDRQAAGVG